jgi:hypothetical protein
MSSIAPVVMIALLVAVIAVLLVGVFVMARGGALNSKYGNKIMRARVVLQVLAIVALAVIWLVARD